MATWKDLSRQKRLELLKRSDAEDIGDLAKEVGMIPTTLARRLREIRQWGEIQVGGDDEKALPEIEKIIPEDPENHELYALLKRGPISLRDLSKKFDRSIDTVLGWIDELEQAGYVIEQTESAVLVSFDSYYNQKPKVTTPQMSSLGKEIIFGVISDLHSGSRCSQPTWINEFVNNAVNVDGVRHFFVPGDVTAGVKGYRGQEYDLLPGMLVSDPVSLFQTTKQQIRLADSYLPQIPGVQYYVLGGNHDWWHVIHTGIDAVRRLAHSRDDILFLGYDTADVPLTERIAVRMIHPSGGVPYALSYRLQKNVEQVAFGELNRLCTEIQEDEISKQRIRFLLAGHLHIECKFQSGPIVASQVGCFEGQTNYLKRKGLFPQVGGQIWRVTLTEQGQISRVDYSWIPFEEIQDDWENWNFKRTEEVIGVPDDIDVIFKLSEQ